MVGDHSIRLADDDRARIPFALVGVLLLVTSTAYAGALSTAGVSSSDRSVERAMERATADATPAVRHAAEEAARDAAREPVTVPADTVAGDAIRSNHSFEDALRIRIYLAVESALDATATRNGNVRAVASLPTIEEPEDLVRARDRVDVEPVDDGAAFRATVRNVTMRATRGGRTVAESTATLSVTVAVPVFAAHERTERFERRLNRGPLDGPGLGRQLTARLYAVTWARGYAQYGGAPVTNVLSNRHVELSTNAGLVRTQESVFGTADPEAREGVRRATARTGTADLVEPAPLDEEAWTDAVLADPVEPSSSDGVSSGSGSGRTAESSSPVSAPYSNPAEDSKPFPADAPSADDEFTIGVDRTADAAFQRMIEHELEEVVRETYRVEATLETDVATVVAEPRPGPVSPGENWSLVDESMSSEHAVEGTGGEDGFATATREIVVTHTATRYWARGGERRTTERSWVRRYRVVVAVDGEHVPNGGAPDRPTEPVFEPGGAIDGSNLDGAPAAARTQLEAVDVDEVALEAVRGGGVDDEAVIYGTSSAELDDWIYRDLADFRERLRRVTVDVDRGAVASGDANPPTELAATLRKQRQQLIDPPEEYDGVADRARVAARAAYLDAVVALLEERAANTADRNEELAGALDERDVASSDRLEGVLDARTEATESTGAPGGDVVPATTLTPYGSPGYLPRSAVDGDRVRAVDGGTTVRPLAVRNVNHATVPYGDVSEGIVDRLLGGDDVPLRSAGRTLAATDRALSESADPPTELRERRDVLADDVAEGLDAIDQRLDAELQQQTRLAGEERRAVLRAASDNWDAPAERAAVVGTGEYADTVAAEAAETADLDERERDELAVRLRLAAGAAADSEARIDEDSVAETADVTREVARSELERSVEDGLREAGDRASDRWMPKAMRGVGAGLPVAPVPGYWYATVNGWTVEVRGTIPWFVVAGDGGIDGGPGASFGYVREAGTATVTVGGEEVVLGTTEPIRFETGTTVVVAVPPGPPGVGDVDGVRDEQSPAWPCPDVDGGTASIGSGANTPTGSEACR